MMFPEEAVDAVQRDDRKHLRDYFRILYKRKGLLLALMCIAFISSALLTFSKTPIYTASTMVLIEKNLDTNRIEGFGGYFSWDPEFQATQFELIRSFNVAKRVVQRLQLDSQYQEYFFSQEEEGKTSSYRLLSSWLQEVLGAVEDWLSPYLLPPERQQTQEAQGQDPGQTLQGPSVAEQIAQMIQANLRVEPIRDTKIVHVLYSHKNPELAQKITDAVVQAYIDENLEIKSSTSHHTLQWMSQKTEEEKKKLEESENALQRYMREHDIVTVENRLTVLPERLAGLSKELSEAETKEKELAASYQQIERAGKNYTSLESLPLFMGSSVLQTLRSQLLDSEQNLRSLSGRYGEKHPSLLKAQEEHELLQRAKRAEMDRIVISTKNSYDLARTKVRDIRKMLEETKAELLDMNERFIQYTILQRDNDSNRAVYDALSSSIKKTDVTAQSMDVKIWVMKKAQLPQSPSHPNKQKELILGLLLGIVGGISVIFFLEYLDNSVHSGREIEERYNLTVLGTVENLSGKKHRIESYILEHPLSPLAESYRLIRSGLLLSTPEQPPKIILITSMVQQEGKTTTAKNLAHSLAQNEKKVLLIDCDMRRPRQHSMFGLSNAYGLSNYLAGTVDPEQPLIQAIPESPLFLISSGTIPPNPAELLSSQRMQLLLEEMRGQFDFILLDSPPVQQVTDSLMLGPLADGTIVVIRAGKTTYEMLDSGIKKLRESRSRILGLVLNRLKKKNADKGYYGYYSYYSHYGKGDHYRK
jgi:capsular exopolysaccharide synthesis family protein